MKNIAHTKKQIHFRAVETPTAWLVVAIAWKRVDGKVVYSNPKVVRIIPKEETALAEGALNACTFLLSGTSLKTEFTEAILSPYSFIFKPERSGSLTWYGARPPCLVK